MARRDDVLGVTGAETMIASGVTVKGNVSSEGDIIVDGTLTGEVRATGDVTVGINGVVKASVRGNNITVLGSIIGNLNAEGEVTIRESGQVHGDITAAGLAIVSGGIFIGTNAVTGRDSNGHAKAEKV